jgi:hypothetical protein
VRKDQKEIQAIWAMALDPSKNLYVGGRFTTIAGQLRSGYAVLAAPAVPGAPPIGTATPARNVVEAALVNAGAVGGAGVTFTEAEAWLWPTALLARTEHEYNSPLVRPVTVIGDPGPVAPPPGVHATV